MKELKFLRRIKSIAFATAENGIPHVRIADVMLIEDDRIYFTTARGKSFYRQVTSNPYVALVGMDEKYKTVRVSGYVKKVGREYVDKIFIKNPMMNDLYPGEKRDVLEAFCIYKGIGETFDLSTVPPKRTRFSFGGEEVIPLGYRITDKCKGCGICKESCPEDAIIKGDAYVIDSKNCLECGRCYEHCPYGAIEIARTFDCVEK